MATTSGNIKQMVTKCAFKRTVKAILFDCNVSICMGRGGFNTSFLVKLSDKLTSLKEVIHNADR